MASAAWRRSPPTTPKQVLGDKLFTKTTSMRNKKDKDTLSYENLQIWLKDGFEGLESEKEVCLHQRFWYNGKKKIRRMKYREMR